MPDLVRKSYDEIKTWADDVHVQIRQVAIPHSSPTGTCIAQWPCATQACSRQEGIVVLVSASTSPYRLMPDLMGFFFQDAVHVCQQAEVAVERLGEEEGQTIVVHQQPQAGTIIDRRKQIIVLSTAQHAPIFY
jgi:beta-lactam-binding protein with PASTA domain